jgi:hypothetical protein
VTRRMVLRSALAAVMLLLPAAPAFAVELVEVREVSCDGLTVAGWDLPANQALTLTVWNAEGSKALARVPVRTSAQGRFQTRVRVSLRGQAAVEADVQADGRSLISTTQRFDAAHKQRCGAGAALPFTGPSRTELLVSLGAVLLAAGVLLRRASAYVGSPYRGRHQAR